ncbi:MAG: hypothetical protein J7L82_04135 [Staphylothermus sp.]|nr:hypothetical protein [Staphylothermus sp.]
MTKDIKLVEGFPIYHNGVVYLVKGFQHPEGLVITYPRYMFLERRKIHKKYEIDKHVTYFYWDCIKQVVPVVNLSAAYSFFEIFGKYISYESLLVKKLLSELLNTNDLFITGSSLFFDSYNDVDIVILGADTEIINEVKRLINKNVLKRVTQATIMNEYLLKHKNDTDLKTYLFLKKDTLSHIIVNGIYVNIKYVSYNVGFNQCIEPVEERIPFEGKIRIIDCLNRHILPTRYVIQVGNEKLLMETFREIYSEIPPGYYYVKGHLEYRKNGKILVPDHGSLHWIE